LISSSVQGGEEHARRAGAALQTVVLGEGLLDRVELAVVGEALDGEDVGAASLDGEHEARLDGLAVDDDGAGAADAVLAADVGAG
jgi:hypothetical protein